MTDSRDRISGPTPADTADDPDSQTFFEDGAPESAPAGRTDLVGDAGGDAIADGVAPAAGYTGGLAGETGSAAGMRAIIRDERAADPRAGEREENLAQQDQ
jgi:hypothetical protein